MTSTGVSTIVGLFSLVLTGQLCAAGALSKDQEQCLSKGRRFERHGWIYLHVEGEAKERGFQHGYLLAAEIAEGLKESKASWEYTSSMTWPWLVERAAKMFVSHIDAENLEELEGIANRCSGQTRLTARRRTSGTGTVTTIRLGRPTFSIAAGTQAKVKVHLSRAGRPCRRMRSRSLRCC